MNIDMKNFFKVCLIIISINIISCQDMDIPPMNIINDEDIFSSDDGIRSYIARMYSELPMEDFRYSHTRLFNHFWLVNPFSCISGEGLSRDVGGAATESGAYWDNAYVLIREANYFKENLANYADRFSEDEIAHLQGEASFIRAFTYFALAKRFGGVPILDRVVNYPADGLETMQLPRSSEEETWDFVSTDFDFAIANMRESSQRGRANKHVAAALKSRAMLYAGSVAKYNTITLFDNQNRMICGIPAQRASDYFKQSYDAAKSIEGVYSLFVKDWRSNDPEAQYQNYVNLFFDESSTENILVKEYNYPETVHGWDAYNVPRQAMGPNGYSAEINPTLEFVELFDGIEKNPDGTFRNLDANGNYRLFDNTMQPFENVEPRLRATAILPGDIFKGESIEIRRGIYTAPVGSGIAPLIPAGALVNYPTDRIVQSANQNQTPYQLPDGTLMNPAGLSGTFSANRESSISGFSIRKYLDPNRPRADVRENFSDQTWIELRYAEVLLSRAEAAVELHEAGVSGVDYLTDAFTCVNQIRERAGAELLGGPGNLSIEVVRKERRKELGFEHKTYWDLKRWRIADIEQNARIYRILMPFYVAETGQYFFDARHDERNSRYTFDSRWYYQQIPSAEITKNPNLVQNPGF